MLSKALVVGAYQRKLEELAKFSDVALIAIVPPFWREAGHRVFLERRFTHGYDLIVEPMALNGSFHLHFYPHLWRRLRDLRPEIVHIDEEPYNLATLQALVYARRIGAKTLFFTWQNILRNLPPPFNFIERYNLDKADRAIAGSDGAKAVLLAKRFSRPIAVIPQFGVDADLFSPRSQFRSDRFVVGYVGRIVEAKGLVCLVDAFAGLREECELRIIGDGPFKAKLEKLVSERGLADRVVFVPYTSSLEIPLRLRELDALVLPSLTTPRWKEQFGRVLIEAMACAVPVVGSDSGEIPNVIGDAGLIFPEGDSQALQKCLARLVQDEELWRELALRGRKRVLDRFTQARIAEQTYEVYRGMVS